MFLLDSCCLGWVEGYIIGGKNVFFCLKVICDNNSD